MNIVILAAGIGSRLGGLTKEKPKSLVSINNESLFEKNLKVFNHFKFKKKILVVVGYKNALFRKFNVVRIKNNNYRYNGILDSFLIGLNKINQYDNALFLYGDITYTKETVKKILESKYDFTVPTLKNWKPLWEKRFKNPLLDLETCKIGNSSQIKEIGMKPKNYHDINGQYMGILYLKKKVVFNLKNHLKKNPDLNGLTKRDMTTFLNYQIKSGVKIHTVQINGGWFEFDTPNDINIFEQNYPTNDLSHVYKWE